MLRDAAKDEEPRRISMDQLDIDEKQRRQVSKRSAMPMRWLLAVGQGRSVRMVGGRGDQMGLNGAVKCLRDEEMAKSAGDEVDDEIQWRSGEAVEILRRQRSSWRWNWRQLTTNWRGSGDVAAAKDLEAVGITAELCWSAQMDLDVELDLRRPVVGRDGERERNRKVFFWWQHRFGEEREK